MIERKNKKEFIIYTPIITSRLEYIFDFILFQELGLEYELCNDKLLFEKSDLKKFSYSTENLFPDIPFIQSHQLLESEKIEKINIDIFIFNEIKAFFKTSKDSFFPFDIFSAGFYLISRYEEYLPFTPDNHGRFPAEQSLAYKEDFLEEPLINIWIQLFKPMLLKKFPDVIFKNWQFRFLSTIDIDNAFADLNKGFLRTSMSLMKLMFTFQKKALTEKIKVLKHTKEDKFDNYEFLNQVHQTNQLDPIYFILFSKYGKFDKNLSRKNPAFIKLIKNIAESHQIGIHPSYRSNNSVKTLSIEKELLEKAIGHPVKISRQHFLKLNLPLTYENLIKIGIEQDYSMGYPSLPGFRAGVCSIHHFFNLKTNKKTNLQIIPFAIMDACFIHYLRTEPEKSLKKIKKILNSVKKVNGLFVSLWHNESLYKTQNQISWQDIFKQMLLEIKDGNSI